jgi:MFS family permease
VFELTGSGLAVALVSAVRTLPMLLFGALAGVVSDAVNRKHILQCGILISAASAISVCVLALSGVLTPWHVAAAAFVSGSVWATEMATRRRMVGEAAGGALVSRAVALDSLTNALTRMLGPLMGSLAYATVGISGAFAISACCYLLGALLVPGLRHSQEAHRLVLSRVPRDLAEGFAFARSDAVVLAVLAVTMIMNLFAFTYIALVAPLAQVVFRMPPAWAGALAAAEPLGSMLGGIILASVTPRASPRAMMLSGSALFLAALGVMPLIPGYFAACAVLVLGGLGLALFGNMQTTLILTGSPLALRSRIMGLITVCIGAGPVGQLLIGTLGDRIGPLAAVMAVALAGLAGLGVVAVLWRAAPAPALLSTGPLSAAPDPAAAPGVRRQEKAASTAGNTLPPPAVRRSSAGT